jgi:RNA polymerase sigma factor (sigma-70 family)
MSHALGDSRLNPFSNVSSSQTGEVTRAIRAVQRQRDSQAEQAIVNHFWKRVAGLARKKLEMHKRARRTMSASDAAQSALHSFFRAIEQGKYHDLDDRKGVWNLLATITTHEVLDQVRRQQAAKRAKEVGESALPDGPQGKRTPLQEVAIDSSVSPADQAENAELCAESLANVCEKLFPQLSAKEQETAALVAEHGTGEAAKRLGLARSTVQVRMRAIRAKIANIESQLH